MKKCMVILKKFLITGIRFYKRYLSPMKTVKCPYFPSCSDYAIEAMFHSGKWGVFMVAELK